MTDENEVKANITRCLCANGLTQEVPTWLADLAIKQDELDKRVKALVERLERTQ